MPSSSDRSPWLTPAVCLGLALLFTGCAASSTTPESTPGAAPAAASPRGAPASRPTAGKPLDAPCKADAECMAGLSCATRPQGELEDAAPTGPVCRGSACSLGETSCQGGGVCCPLLTGVYGPYCLPDCRKRSAGFCAPLLDSERAACNRDSGCCHVPKVLRRAP